jgi:ABC-type glycerol-3-phosphate transport system permease component
MNWAASGVVVWSLHLALFLLRQFFLSLPTELTDAANIDGCSHVGILPILLAFFVQTYFVQGVVLTGIKG